MKSDEVYLSIGVPTYKHSKSQVLGSQVNLLNSLKRMHNLKVLTRQKHDLKKEFGILLSKFKTQLDEMKESIPKDEIPTIIREKEKKKEERESRAKKEAEKKAENMKKKEKSLSKRESIDSELQRIQEKLRSLGA